MNDRLKQMQEQDYYPKKLRADIASFNAALLELQEQDKALSIDADKLQSKAAQGAITALELFDEKENLEMRRLDNLLRERKLCLTKRNFQDGVTAARGTERLKRAEACQAYAKQFSEKLAAIAPGNRYTPGLLNEDKKMQELKGLLGAVSDYQRVFTAEDEQREAGLIEAILQHLPAAPKAEGIQAARSVFK